MVELCAYALNFGEPASPLVFNKHMRARVKYLRQHAIGVVIYLDDLAFVIEGSQAAALHARDFVEKTLCGDRSAAAPIEGPVSGALPGFARPFGVRGQHPAQSVARAGEALPHHLPVSDGPARRSCAKSPPCAHTHAPAVHRHCLFNVAGCVQYSLSSSQSVQLQDFDVAKFAPL